MFITLVMITSIITLLHRNKVIFTIWDVITRKIVLLHGDKLCPVIFSI